jgi:predicted acylesterase/phospholipase RssA
VEYREERNIPTYVVDSPYVERVTIIEPNSPAGLVEVISGITSLFTGTMHPGTMDADLEPAKNAAQKMYKLYKFVYPFGFIKLALRVFGARKKLRKAGKSNQVAAKLVEKPSDLTKYFYSLLFDRGLFSGIAIRKTMCDIAAERLKISHEKAATLTFDEFFSHTENDLRITGTNVTKGIPVYFSKELTPDFPVVDAVCMSAAIPLAFKPTLSQALAHKGRDPAHNERYRGFFNDGGTLNNLPIHAFDFFGDEDNFMKKVVTMNSHMFGIRCTGGNPTDCEEDKRFPYDPNYISYLDEEKKKNEGLPKKDRKKFIEPKDVAAKICDVKTTYQIEMIYDALTPLLEFTGNLLNTLMYGQEDGQIRSEDEFRQTMELFSYDVGLFDFTISVKLSDFVQARAAIKVGLMIGIDKLTIHDLVIGKYYVGKEDAEVNKYIDHADKYIQEYKKKHKIDPS